MRCDMKGPSALLAVLLAAVVLTACVKKENAPAAAAYPVRIETGCQFSYLMPCIKKSLLARRNWRCQSRIEALVPQAQRALQACEVP